MSEEKIIYLLKNNRFDEAKNLIFNLLKTEKENLKYNFYYGLTFAHEKKFVEAIEYFSIFLNKNKSDYDTNFNLANCYLGLLNFEKAIEYYENCTRLNHNRHEPYHQVGVCYRLVRDYQKSIVNLNKALSIKENTLSYYILGKVFRDNGQFDEARKSFEKSIFLNEKFIDSKLSLANIENDCGNYDEAFKIVNKIIQANEQNNQVYVKSNIIIGNILKSKGDYKSAIEVNQKILEIEPNNADALYHLSLCYLFMKDFDNGWKYHESRYNLQSFVLLKKIRNSFIKPIWGGNKPKKNILIYGEQGIGEQILYSQFIEVIQDQFEKITIAVNKKLIPFFKKIYKYMEIIDYRSLENYDKYDYHLPMGSLGQFFQNLVNYNSFKKEIFYSFDNNKVPKKNKKLRCGISWKSTNKIFGKKKSIELEQLSNLFLLNDIEFINLQYSNEKEEINILEKRINKSIFLDHKVDCFNDIDGTAGLIKSCDFVITVSNSNAHIAGKLGVKTFLLLPFNDGKLWYWGLNTDNNIIWYPSIKPVRMENENDWSSCISNLNKELENFL